MAEIGLVTVLFNSNEVLDGFLKSISIQSFTNYHLYLIDNTPNNITDAILYKLLKQYGIVNYTHIKNETNVGIAKGNNQGINLAQKRGCKYCLILNNDIEFYQNDLIERMYLSGSQKKEPIIIPKIYYYGTNKIWMAGGKLFKLSGKTIHVGDLQESSDLYNKPTYFKYAPTCFMLVNTDVFAQVGLMDEKYFVYYDDTDFIYRCTNYGYKIYYMPDIEVMHKVSTSTGGGNSIFTIYYTNRNRLYFIRKNFKGIFKIVSLFVTLSTRLGKMLVYNKEQNKAMWKAVFDGLKM